MFENFDVEEKVSEKEKAWAATSHLMSYVGLLSFIIVLAFVTFDVFIKSNLNSLYFLILPVIINAAVPFVVWNRIKTISPFVEEHSKQSLNFQLSVTLYFVISIAAVFIAVGVVLLFILVIFDINVINDAFKKARDGEPYRYPMSINFFR